MSKCVLRTVDIKARPNDCNIIQHCQTILCSVKRGAASNMLHLFGHLNSRVWDQYLPLESKPAPYWFAHKMAQDRSTSGVRVRPSSRFSWSYRFTYSLICPFSFYLKRDRLCLSFRFERFETLFGCHAIVWTLTQTTREANINKKSLPWIQKPTKTTK